MKITKVNFGLGSTGVARASEMAGVFFNRRMVKSRMLVQNTLKAVKS
jgi:hypothetical protein